MSDQSQSMNCECTPVYETCYEGENEPLVAVVEALASVKDVEPLEMEPLYNTIDVDAVNRLFGDHDDSSEPTLALSFSVDGWNIFVRDDGLIRVCDPDMPDASAPAFEKAIGD